MKSMGKNLQLLHLCMESGDGKGLTIVGLCNGFDFCSIFLAVRIESRDVSEQFL